MADTPNESVSTQPVTLVVDICVFGVRIIIAIHRSWSPRWGWGGAASGIQISCWLGNGCGLLATPPPSTIDFYLPVEEGNPTAIKKVNKAAGWLSLSLS